jgi:hypothetical protein
VFSSLQETAVKLYESIERPLRGENNYEKPYDLSLEHTAATLTVKPLKIIFKTVDFLGNL